MINIVTLFNTDITYSPHYDPRRHIMFYKPETLKSDITSFFGSDEAEKVLHGLELIELGEPSRTEGGEYNAFMNELRVFSIIRKEGKEYGDIEEFKEREWKSFLHELQHHKDRDLFFKYLDENRLVEGSRILERRSHDATRWGDLI